MLKFCPICGKRKSDNLTYCTECGANINSIKSKLDEKPIEEEKIQVDKSDETKTENKKIEGKYSFTNLLVYGVIIVVVIIFFSMGIAFIAGMSGNVKSTASGSNLPLIQSSPSNLPFPIPTQSQTDRNFRIANEIVSNYHKSHIYSLNDMYVCVDMASDVWDMLKAQGINAKINVGNINKDVTDIKDADHAWVLAEIAPNSYLALETTGGYSVQKADNPRYYNGWSYDNPKELKDALEKLKHPCPDGYIFGSDEKCHPACGGNSYCTGNNVCVNGQCKGCDSGYILGDDLKCHQPCGGATRYCTGDSVCVNGQCKGCDPGYILGDDLKCHQPCGSTTKYCTGDSICVNGQCRGCDPGYYLGTDLRCHKS